jgi:hypothetical protein
VYAKSSISIAGGHSVVAKQVTIGTTMQSLPLFTTVNVPIRVSVPAAIAPRPGGSISVSRSGMTTVTRTLSPVSSSSSIASTASFPFRATFSERPSACFSVQYATDGFYPSTTGSVCIPTGPAVTALALSVPAKSYNFGQPFPITVNLTFPAELGILNRSVTINPVPGTVEMTPAVGQAGVTLQPILPFNAGGLKASYGGGGDLASATAELELTMNPIATSLILQPIPASVSNPFTLRAEVRSAVPLPSAGQSALGGPVQFFDGELFIGSAPLAIGSDGVHRATLSNVIRPVGPRFIRVVYDGNKLFNGSKSTVVQTTVE